MYFFSVTEIERTLKKKENKTRKEHKKKKQNKTQSSLGKKLHFH